MGAYSLDLRQRIVAALQDGMTQVEVARQFRVSLATVERYWRRHRQGQSLAPRPIPGGSARVMPPEQHDVLLRHLHEHPDWTLHEHVAWWRDAHGPVSVATLWRRLQQLHWTRKKDAARRRT